MKETQLAAIIVGGIGALGLFAGLLWIFATKKFLSRAQTTTGTVTDLVERRSSSASSTTSTGGMRTTTYAPAVRFQAADGRQIDFVSSVSSSSQATPVGSTVEVLYLPDNPEKAKLKRGMWLGPVIFLFVGALLAGVGVVIFAVG